MPGAAAPVAARSSEAPATEAPKRNCSVMIYGDSIAFGAQGVFARIEEPPAAAVKRLRPAYVVTDRSMPGGSAHLQLGSFMNDTLDSRVVVIEYGINDATNGFEYEAPLRAMVQRVKSAGRIAVVTGLSRIVGHVVARDEYDAVARKVASEEGAVFADWGAAPYSDFDMQDSVHPAQAYSTRLVERLVQALDVAAPDCADGG
jgi:hypothetical protein